MILFRSILFNIKSLPHFIFTRNSSYFPVTPKTSTNLISHYSNLIDRSLTSHSPSSPKLLHAHLIKLGLNTHTFLCNRLLDIYSKLGSIHDALHLFDDLDNKNSFTWNVLLTGFFKHGLVQMASSLFDEMPQRDVVSWNSMISGYASNGFVDCALRMFSKMLSVHVKQTAFTFSIVMSCVSSLRQGMEVHGCIMRSGLNSSNLVLSNCLIDMYGNFKLLDYAFGVFIGMEEFDVISWNSLISACHYSDCGELALHQFCSMRTSGYLPDKFTVSTVITACAGLCALEMGKQVFVLSVKMGFLSNSIVSSATIDMFSKCNRLDDSVRIFEELYTWDSAVCNSMISGYIVNGCEEKAHSLFVLSLRANVRPTEFTLSSILTSTSLFIPENQGIQIHPLVIKLGFQSYAIVASSLIDLYAKYGLIDSAMEIFSSMGFRDLVTWNTIFMGLARNGQGSEALELFGKLLEQGVQPDRITLFGVLLACCHGSFFDNGRTLFLSMEKKYSIIPGVEHYACFIDITCRMGGLLEAIEIVERMPHEPNALIWESLLCASKSYGDLKLTERIAERAVELETRSSLPYSVLAKTYEMKGRWESVVRVKKAMRDKGVKKVNGCSWIRIKSQVFAFRANQILLYGGENSCSILRLLLWEMEIEGYVYEQNDNIFVDEGE